jgi:hypothetical protein
MLQLNDAVPRPVTVLSASMTELAARHTSGALYYDTSASASTASGHNAAASNNPSSSNSHNKASSHDHGSGNGHSNKGFGDPFAPSVKGGAANQRRDAHGGKGGEKGGGDGVGNTANGGQAVGALELPPDPLLMPKPLAVSTSRRRRYLECDGLVLELLHVRVPVYRGDALCHVKNGDGVLVA